MMEDFPEPDRQQWLDLVEQTLGGRSFEDVLVSTTLDGIALQPLYESVPVAPAVSPITRGARPWQLRAYVDAGAWLAGPAGAPADAQVGGRADTQTDAQADALANIAAEVEGGADCLYLDFSGVDGKVFSGPDAIDGLRQLIGGLDLSEVALAFEAGLWWPQVWEMLKQLPLAGSLRADPIAAWARSGQVANSPGARLADIIAGKPKAPSNTISPFDLKVVGVDATVFADSGASEAQELGLSLASGHWYLQELSAHGIGTDQACAEMEFSYVATADIFATVAKLRAARLCWQRLAQECGATAEASRQYQHAVSSKTMLARLDQTVNVLRSTTAAFGAAVGGADAICVLPHDFVGRGPRDSGAHRLARNISHILLDEAHLAQVADPAHGSGYVEELTQQLASKAWDLFAQIQDQGGIVAVLESGEAAGWLADTWQRRLSDIRHRRQPICGVSEFPDLDEVEAAGRDGAGGDGAASAEAAGRAEAKTAFPLRRLAEPYENLRDRAANIVQSGTAGRPPTVFLAVLGTFAEASARVGFTQNLLAAGGIVAVLGSGEEAGSGAGNSDWREKLAAEFKASQTPMAVICSSDETYQSQASQAADTLRAAGCEGVYLAGKIKGEQLSQINLDGSLHAGFDAVEFLDGLLTRFEQTEAAQK